VQIKLNSIAKQTLASEGSKRDQVIYYN